ncbi:CP2 transcription factor [Akanthomyces lecanii RCEF 1005]|uniref:CP2 transcription factor n=1 Tax=Akanthomyces lecanii RCEF 1005 TaxID=1081108 RepID=A0A162KFQ6_CORDF|nr:CP2 transcription factor [Akanthomyces lecanii RCEF 1005]
MYDYAEDFPSYMYIYETVCDICKQQCSIIDEGADLLLSSVFCALPLLKEVSLYFCETLAFDHGPLNRDARKDEPYQYHLEAVTNAIHNARRRGVAIHSIGLYALDFPDIHTGEEPSMAIVLKSLRRLLKDMIVLRLRGRECIFKLLSHGALGIHQLEMCGMQVADTTLKDFLQANEETRNMEEAYRTFIRVSFEDEEQRSKPSVCWGLWKEGRGTDEAHQRGGKLQAVEYVKTSQPAEGDDKRTRTELESSSHSKGVKGISVRLCAKTTQLSGGDGPVANGEAKADVCFCKVKLFRDHGAERKLSNDAAHIKKNGTTTVGHPTANPAAVVPAPPW